jgi:hypothetical protein
MHEGFACIGGKNGGTPTAHKCMTSMFKGHELVIEGRSVVIPPLAITTARCENETERNKDTMNLRYWAV